MFGGDMLNMYNQVVDDLKKAYKEIDDLKQELQRKDNIIKELKEWARLEKYLQTTKVEEKIYDEFLDKIKELENDN